MANVIEEQIIITISQLVKNGTTTSAVLAQNPDLLATIESVVQELVGDAAIVEVTAGE